MTVFAKTGQLARRLIRGLIHRLWVQPLETRIIPRLSVKKPDRAQSLLFESPPGPQMSAGSIGKLCLSVIRWTGRTGRLLILATGFQRKP
jgi:hypothetical protein